MSATSQAPRPTPPPAASASASGSTDDAISRIVAVVTPIIIDQAKKLAKTLADQGSNSKAALK